jgi:lysophospholipase L1-like esterase
VELIRGLPRAEHTVTLYKLTEPLVGDTTVHAFVMDQYGEALPTLAPAPRRIEVIGDSISAGYGNEGAGPNCPFSAETENHFLSYAARAARALNADLTTLAWSGRGVFTNRGSTTETETMSVLWKRVLPSEGGSSWGFPAPPPDAVIINLGTNDFAPEVKDETPFRAAYDALLSDVRQHYPDAQLFAAVGPLLSDAYPEGRHALTTVRTTLRELVGARTSGGDAKLHYLEFEPVLADEGYGCDFHPSVKTHTRMAAELVSALSTTLGWK